LKRSGSIELGGHVARGFAVVRSAKLKVLFEEIVVDRLVPVNLQSVAEQTDAGVKNFLSRNLNRKKARCIFNEARAKRMKRAKRIECG